MNNRNQPISCTMPAGTYYVGDLCYVMHPEWNEFCDLTTSGRSCLDGKFTLADGRTFVTFGTAYGDGVYAANNGASLGVDAGLIGCIKLEDIRDPEVMIGGKINEVAVSNAGTIVVMTEDFVCSAHKGVMNFGRLYINTGHTDIDE